MRDRFGLVPATIRANYEREEMVERHIGSAVRLLAAVRAYDPDVDVVFMGDRSDPEYGVVPGRWHFYRKNEGAPDTYIAITTEDGGYREPDEAAFNELRDRDLWKQGVRERYERQFTPQPSKSDEGIVEELASDVRAGHRIPGDAGLTKRKWGRG